MKKTTPKNDSSNTGAAIGAGLAAVAAAVAGAYFLYGSKNAAKNRKIVKSWSLKAKAEVLERLEGLTDVSQDMYNSVIQEVTDQYKTLKHLDAEEVVALALELKDHWKDISKEIMTAAKKKSSKK